MHSHKYLSERSTTERTRRRPSEIRIERERDTDKTHKKRKRKQSFCFDERQFDDVGLYKFGLTVLILMKFYSHTKFMI